MESEEGRLFVGGISWDTTGDRLKEYFGKYGEVLQTVIVRNKVTGRSRGFGFVAFANPSLLDRVLQDKHSIDCRTVEAKRATSSKEQQASARSGNSSAGRTSGGGSGANIGTNKIFVGGLPPTLTKEAFCQYFQDYGTDAVDEVLHKTFHELNGKLVEVKHALPKDANPSGGGARSMGGGSYQAYGGSGVNSSSCDGRMETYRYMQPQAAGVGIFHMVCQAMVHQAMGYGAPSNGYGATNNGVGYGGYGLGVYGSAAAGFREPAGGGYGNPNAPLAGYVSGPPGGLRNLWNNQAPTAYGSAGYDGNTAYGDASTWNAPAGCGAITAPTCQSPSGTTRYGNEGYDYRGYVGVEGPCGSQGGYGAVRGHGSSDPTSNPSSVQENKGQVLVTWVVAMVMLMGSQVIQMLGDLTLHGEGLMELLN
ncbi:heterogeneous nuclear ribonucleoprotein 1 [Cocos nucifera]|uniref:Heterogeneous nuclear ribonucleoprotein 1 n=1 Tax=Cocos nucifera TaxID=13894 RepID=A0A8K0ILD6_COCNU|nr:heterogeneous nuclear ribonucleoprotein 1 [Cocos nucifera]